MDSTTSSARRVGIWRSYTGEDRVPGDYRSFTANCSPNHDCVHTVPMLFNTSLILALTEKELPLAVHFEAVILGAWIVRSFRLLLAS